MYKGASRFFQSMAQRGRKIQGGSNAKKLKTGRKNKSKLARRLDRAAEQRRMREWFGYLDDCHSRGKEPVDVPEDVMRAWKLQN